MRRSTSALLAAAALLQSVAFLTHAQGPTSGLRVLSREGARQLQTVTLGNQDYVALDDVAAMFGLSLREDRLAGGVTVTQGARSVIVTPGQPLVSVAGRLAPLSAPPQQKGNRWFVPLDFLQRAVGPLLDTRMELRRNSRLVIVGDIRVPHVTARVDQGQGSTTVVFDSSPATPARVALGQGRLTVSYEADALDLVMPTATSTEFLQGMQPDSPTSIRIAVGPKFGLHRATTSQPDASTSRLTIELLPAGTEAPAAPAAPTPAPAPDPAPPPVDPLPLPAPGLRTIVIDPGHGGDETGARGSGGTLEKDITLAIARRLRTAIESRLGLRVFLTRDDDRAMSLDNRSAYANSQRADLFISIHANAALGPAMRGAEVYYLSLDAGAAESQGLDGSPPVALPALGGGTRSIDFVPWEMAQIGYIQQSSVLAGTMEQTLRARVEMSSRPLQQAPFRVLVGAGMPAVLVEAGYLSNPEQEQRLTTAAYQDRIALGLFDGVVQFRAYLERSAPRALDAGAQP